MKERTIKVCLILGITGLVPGGLGALTPEDVRVRLELESGSGSVKHTVSIERGRDGSTILDVLLYNPGGEPVTLSAIEVALPWLPESVNQPLISSGASSMLDTMRNVDLKQAEEVPPSSMYLLSNDAGDSHLAGFLSWRTFDARMNYLDRKLFIRAEAEGRVLESGEQLAFERIYLSNGKHWQDLLFEYADAIAGELRIDLRPRPRFVGWSTWDYYGREWLATDVLANARDLKGILPGANLIQIDGGWWPVRGDFLDVRDNLKPGGMGELARGIRELGFSAGIHFDGVRADRRSTIAKEHPEYFLTDESGDWIRHTYRQAPDELQNIFFDYSHPGTREYLVEVVRNMRRDWGYDYIKIDFLMHAINSDIRLRALKGDTSTRIIAHDRSITSVERLRLGLQAFREGMGPDAYFLACTAPIGMSAGFADGFRTGPDISPNVEQFRIDCLATGANFYLDGTVYHNDADYVVVRAAEDEDDRLVRNPEKTGGDLSVNEAALWANYVGLFGGPFISSDNLGVLRPERQRLLQEAATLPRCERYVPLDYWQRARHPDDAFQVFLGEAKGEVYLALFNWEEKEQTYTLEWAETAEIHLDIETSGEAIVLRESGRGYTIYLPARHSGVFRVAGVTGFDELRRNIRVSYSFKGSR